MNLLDIQPLSYLASNTSDVVKQVNDTGHPVAISVDGQVQAVLQDSASYHKTQDQIAMLRLLAMGRQQVEAGKVQDHDAVVALFAAQDRAR